MGSFRAPASSLRAWLVAEGRGKADGFGSGLRSAEDAEVAHVVRKGAIVEGPPLDASSRAFARVANVFCEYGAGAAPRRAYAALAGGQPAHAVASFARASVGSDSSDFEDVDLDDDALVIKSFEASDGGILKAYGVMKTCESASLMQLLHEAVASYSGFGDDDDGDGYAGPRPTSKCFGCGGLGHFATSCPRKVAGPPCTKCRGTTLQKTSASEKNPGRLYWACSKKDGFSAWCPSASGVSPQAKRRAW